MRNLAKAWKAIQGPGATQSTYIIDVEVADSGEMPGEGALPEKPDAPKPLGRRKRVKLSKRSGEGGFTLIELLVVVIILGLLVGLVGPRLLGRVGQSRTAAAKAQIELFGAALDQYKLDNGSYPTTDQGLDALVRNPFVGPNNWAGPYLKKSVVPKDPWANPYRYVCCPAQHGDYALWSYGADNAPGGDGDNADVTSWQSAVTDSDAVLVRGHEGSGGRTRRAH